MQEIFDLPAARRQRQRALSQPMPDFLWQAVAENLIWRLELTLRHFGRVLVVNAAPGDLARRIADLGKADAIIEADTAAGASLIIHPEALPFGPESLDAVIWASGLERVNDLPGTLIQIRKALKPDGLLLAASLGGESFRELKASWLAADAEGAGASPRVAPMVDVRGWGALLQRAGFALPVADLDRLDVTYGEALTLMREIKAMGLGHALKQARKGLTSPATLARAAMHYGANFADANGRLKASFEIITLTGWAPHESQQKPLKPGSAKMRLADALNPRKG